MKNYLNHHHESRADLDFFPDQFNRVLKPPGGGSSSAESVFSDGASVVSSGSTAGSSMASSPNESRASSTSPKTPAKKYHMKSNFELGDEQPVVPTVNTPRKKSSRPSSKKSKNEIIKLAKGSGQLRRFHNLYEEKNFCSATKSSSKTAAWRKNFSIQEELFSVYSTA